MRCTSLSTAFLMLLALARPDGPAAAADRARGRTTVILATTTSVQDTGLIDVLRPLFERRTGYAMKVLSVGTGAALALGARGEADVVLTHAPQAEAEWLARGNGTRRTLVMHNHLLVVGPADDPARIGAVKTASEALRAIARAAATWVSRDDGSGTDLVEKALFKEIGIAPKGKPWFVSAGQGMSATLTLADQKRAYTLTDRSTFLARKKSLGLVPLVQGDPRLLNLYHVMPVSPARFPAGRGNPAAAAAFADFLVGSEAQRVIASYGLDTYGEPLFTADAGRTEAQVRGR